MFRSLIAVLFLGCSILPAQDLKNLILASGRSGVVEMIEPASLKTVGQIHFKLPPSGVGLNGVSASADGLTLYVEGPISGSPTRCCFLYSVDLTTLATRKAADIWGSHSREAFIISDGVFYRPAELSASGAITGLNGNQLYLSPDRHLLFGVQSSRGPALDVYDLVAGTHVRLVPTGLEGDWWPSGAWSGDTFYLYAAKSDGSAARLWTVPADTLQLGPAVAVPPFGQVPGCSKPRLEEITAAGGNLFVYEVFGGKIDRRNACQTEIPGGAWALDPVTGQLLRRVAADLHFSQVIPDGQDGVLYGLFFQGRAWWQGPSGLVRIDTRDGQVLQSRDLNPDVWRITAAPLKETRTGEVPSLRQ